MACALELELAIFLIYFSVAYSLKHFYILNTKVI